MGVIRTFNFFPHFSFLQERGTVAFPCLVEVRHGQVLILVKCEGKQYVLFQGRVLKKISTVFFMNLAIIDLNIEASFSLVSE